MPLSILGKYKMKLNIDDVEKEEQSAEIAKCHCEKVRKKSLVTDSVAMIKVSGVASFRSSVI
jgi:hypothetical protein